MPTTAATDLLRQLIQGIMRDPAQAKAYSQNPAEYLAAHGVSDHDMSDVDMRSIVMVAAKECDLSSPAKEMIDEYAEPGPVRMGRPEPASSSGAAPGPAADPPPPAQGRPEPTQPQARPEAAGEPVKEIPPPPVEPPMGQNPMQMIEQHISYVTYVTHENNTDIVQSLIDNSTYIDNSSNVSFEVGGSVYGDIDLTNEVSNTTATGAGAVAVGGDVDDSNINTGSGDITSVGSIHAEGSAVAVGGDATNTDNSVTDNSVDDSTNVSVQDSFNDNSTNDNSTNVNVQDSFNTDNSVDDSTNVNVQDSFNTETNTDNSTNIDVDLGSGRPVRETSDDPGFGHGKVDQEPDVRDGTPEQIEAKYGEQNQDEDEPDAYEPPAEVPQEMVSKPIEPIMSEPESIRDTPMDSTSDMGGMD